MVFYSYISWTWGIWNQCQLSFDYTHFTVHWLFLPVRHVRCNNYETAERRIRIRSVLHYGHKPAVQRWMWLRYASGEFDLLHSSLHQMTMTSKASFHHTNLSDQTMHVNIFIQWKEDAVLLYLFINTNLRTVFHGSPSDPYRKSQKHTALRLSGP